MTTCAPSCWSGTATVAVATVSILGFSTSPATAFPPASVRAVSGTDQGQGRAVHPLSAAQLLRAAGQPAGAGEPDRRPRDGEPDGGALAARGGERAGARDHRRDPGRTAGDRESAV